jgi:hypothetical protein
MSGEDREMRAASGGRNPDPSIGDPLEEGPGGPFGSWRSLYLVLLVYTGAAVVVLFVLTHLLNRGGP